MALNNTERRRILLATTLTVLALPALWWANQSEGASAPNVATVGVEVGVEDGSAPTTGHSSASVPNELGETSPVFLDGPSGEAGFGAAEVAVPAPPRRGSVTASATYSSAVYSASQCIVTGVAHGSTITVVNLDNNRSTTCVTILAPTGSSGEVVLNTRAFSELADLTDAPIPVEIRL
ncbi:MAG: hypothetical protein IZT58_05100 [Actinobacteria bacterium]|nr:hypothetical protein [Actinomycetota bacterium]